MCFCADVIDHMHLALDSISLPVFVVYFSPPCFYFFVSLQSNPATVSSCTLVSSFYSEQISAPHVDPNICAELILMEQFLCFSGYATTRHILYRRGKIHQLSVRMSARNNLNKHNGARIPSHLGLSFCSRWSEGFYCRRRVRPLEMQKGKKNAIGGRFFFFLQMSFLLFEPTLAANFLTISQR